MGLVERVNGCGKERKGRKEKREKQMVFQRIGLGVLAPFLFKFLGAKLSGEQ